MCKYGKAVHPSRDHHKGLGDEPQGKEARHVASDHSIGPRVNGELGGAGGIDSGEDTGVHRKASPGGA